MSKATNSKSLKDEILASLYGVRRHNTHRRADPEKRTADGVVFDSISEMERYKELRDLQRTGEITKLQLQPTFVMIVNDVKICRYTPDFTYLDKSLRVVVEDAKGFKKSKKTGKLLPRVEREFHIKVKLMKALFGLDVKVV